MTTNQGSNIDPLGQLENYDVNDRLNELRNLDLDESFIYGITYYKYYINFKLFHSASISSIQLKNSLIQNNHKFLR